MAIALSNRQEIKTILNLSIAKNYSPVTIVSRLLSKIGCKIKCLRYETQNRKRIRVYQIISPDDDREQVFTHWLNIDQQRPGNSLFWTGKPQVCSAQPLPINVEENNYLQLKLNF